MEVPVCDQLRHAAAVRVGPRTTWCPAAGPMRRYFRLNRGGSAAAGGSTGGAGSAGGNACGTFFGFFASLLPR